MLIGYPLLLLFPDCCQCFIPRLPPGIRQVREEVCNAADDDDHDDHDSALFSARTVSQLFKSPDL